MMGEGHVYLGLIPNFSRPPVKRHGHPHCFHAPVIVPCITSRGCKHVGPEADIHHRKKQVHCKYGWGAGGVRPEMEMTCLWLQVPSKRPTARVQNKICIKKNWQHYFQMASDR